MRRASQARTSKISADTTVLLEPAGATEQVTVTAYRDPLGELESPVTTRTLSPVDLETAAAISMDGQVRQLPGVELFRRSSSLVANPSSQGISLRGLGSTSASRTLVTEDDVPLNDPVGRLDSLGGAAGAGREEHRRGARRRQRSLRIERHRRRRQRRSWRGPPPTAPSCGPATAMRGHVRRQPAGRRRKHGPWGACWRRRRCSAPTATSRKRPWQRGPVDIARNVHSQNGLLLAEHDRGPLRLFVRGSGFNEARSNGTPYQTNGTRLWRYATGGTGRGRMTARSALRALWLSRALPPDLLQHFQPAQRRRSRLLLSLRRNAHPLSAHPGQRTRRRGPLEPAARRGTAACSPEPTCTMCASGTASRPSAQRPR